MVDAWTRHARDVNRAPRLSPRASRVDSAALRGGGGQRRWVRLVSMKAASASRVGALVVFRCLSRASTAAPSEDHPSHPPFSALPLLLVCRLHARRHSARARARPTWFIGFKGHRRIAGARVGSTRIDAGGGRSTRAHARTHGDGAAAERARARERGGRDRGHWEGGTCRGRGGGRVDGVPSRRGDAGARGARRERSRARQRLKRGGRRAPRPARARPLRGAVARAPQRTHACARALGKHAWLEAPLAPERVTAHRASRRAVGRTRAHEQGRPDGGAPLPSAQHARNVVRAPHARTPPPPPPAPWHAGARANRGSASPCDGYAADAAGRQARVALRARA